MVLKGEGGQKSPKNSPHGLWMTPFQNSEDIYFKQQVKCICNAAHITLNHKMLPLFEKAYQSTNSLYFALVLWAYLIMEHDNW